MTVAETSLAVYHSTTGRGDFHGLEKAVLYVVQHAGEALTTQEIRHKIKEEFKILKPASTVGARLVALMLAGKVTNTGPRRKDKYSRNIKQTWLIGRSPDLALTAVQRSLRKLRGAHWYIRNEINAMPDTANEPRMHLQRVLHDTNELIKTLEGIANA